MVSVTEAGGTGTAGAVDGFDVGAKTGTARKLVNGRYVDNKHVGTFIGFAPAKNPRVIVAVTIRRTDCQRLLRRRGCRSRIQRSYERKFEHLGRFPDQAFE